MKKEKLFNYIDRLSTVIIKQDPIEHGLSDINSLMGEVASKRSNAGRVANYIIKRLGDKKRELSTLKSIYEIEYNKLLSENEDVANGESKDERIAIAKSILVTKIEVIQTVQNEVSEWDDLRICINNCLTTLKGAKEALSRQLTVIKHQIDLGEVDGNDFGTK